VSGLGSIGSERIKTDEDRKVANWTIRDSLDLYNVLNWGSGFFAINDAGDVAVHPKTNDERSIERWLRSNDISLEESARLLERYEQGLMGYTYLSGQA
jgi:arginine decarboxylase-like protein